MQQDVWPWGEWKGEVCVLAFTGGMFLPPRPLTLRLLFPHRLVSMNLTASWPAESAPLRFRTLSPHQANGSFAVRSDPRGRANTVGHDQT